MGKLGLARRPEDLPLKQAAAAVGQCELMYVYDKLFGEYNHTVAQILLTAANLRDASQHENFINTLETLLRLQALPIINENDTVATHELRIGDNDTLAAVAAASAGAKLLILLTDIDGLYTADPHRDPNAKLLKTVTAVTPEIEALAGGSGSKVGTGGMVTKLKAAKTVMAAGCDMVIANGRDPDILYDIVAGKDAGTHFLAERKEP